MGVLRSAPSHLTGAVNGTGGRQMNDYETIRQRHVAFAMALAPRLIERLDWPEDRLAAHRVQQLRELVGEVIERSPWHRERLAGVDPGRLDETRLRELPPMTKTDLMNNFDGILTDGRLSLRLVENHLQTVATGSYLMDGYTPITSGGSTGERGVFVYDWEGWATAFLSIFRYLLRAKRSDPELACRPVVSAWVAAADFTHGTAALSRTFSSPDYVNVRLPVTLATEEIVRWAQRGPAGRARGVPLGAARAQLRGPGGQVANRPAAHCELRRAAAAGDPRRGRRGLGRGRLERVGSIRGWRCGRRVRSFTLSPVRGPADCRARRRRWAAGGSGRALGQGLRHKSLQPDPPADPLRDHRRGDDSA